MGAMKNPYDHEKVSRVSVAGESRGGVGVIRRLLRPGLKVAPITYRGNWAAGASLGGLFLL